MKGRGPLYVLGIVLVTLVVSGARGLFRLQALLDDATDFPVGVWPLVLALFLPIAVVIHLTLRRHLAGARLWLVLLALATPLGFALLGLLALANEKLDASAPEVHELRLREVYDVRHGGHRHRYGAFESWRGRGSEVIALDADAYALARRARGKMWRVTIRAGWLGYAWVESLAPAGAA